MKTKLEGLIKDILINEWDPIRVKNNPKAKSECDSYALRIVGILHNGTDEGKITEYLKDLTVNDFGLNYNEKLTKSISKTLLSVSQKR